MLNEKETTQISKFLSVVLRHKPEYIGISLDEQGWTDVHMLIIQAHKKGIQLTAEIIQHVVATNIKKRFSFNADLTKIRASQGHSVQVDLQYQPQLPPEVLYHGTSSQSVKAILKEGLLKMNRHHVHLSIDPETATKVGSRHGKAVVFEVASLKMATDGYTFFVSDNGVWLTDVVPPQYISIRKTGK